MIRGIAAAAVLAALLATAPANAESVCVHKDNCHPVPGPSIVGGGMTDHFTVKLRLFGAEVVHATGVRFESAVPVFEGASSNDTRVAACVNGACSGQTGYTLGWSPFVGNYLRVYMNGSCRQFTESDFWLPGDCVLPSA